MMHYGERIKELRTSRGVSQAGLASAIGVTQGAISQIERGDVTPRLETISSISQALGVELGAFAIKEPTANGSLPEKLTACFALIGETSELKFNQLTAEKKSKLIIHLLNSATLPKAKELRSLLNLMS